MEFVLSRPIELRFQLLWIMHRFCQLADRRLNPRWHKAIVEGARWIVRKRFTEDSDSLHAGLFSGEHLGPGT